MEKTRIAVSGINGFVGKHLAHELLSNGVEVVGIGHDSNLSPDLVGIVSEYHSADLTLGWPSIQNIKGIIHLAGLAAVGPSFNNPQQYINSNSAMVTNMCEYFIDHEQKPRIVIVSSGAIYSPRQDMPIHEDGLIGFNSPYAVSKVLVENQAKYYRNRGLECVVTRPFNHIGPGQNSGFILPDFYSRLANLKDGDTSIDVGNINTRRDYTDVRDIVRAYTRLVLAKNLNYDTYNVCSGVSLSGADILDDLKSAMSLTGVSYTINQSLVRPTDIMEIYGDASRLREDTGWQPEIKIGQTIKDFVNAHA